MDIDAAKRLAANQALERLPQSGTIGLGSGSTAKLFIEGVGRLVAEGRQLVGVATSQDSRRLAESLSIPLLDDQGPWDIDVCVDGADEVSAKLDLIKGGGGCHTREKIVNASAKINIIIVDESKLSQRLGERWPVPIEVLNFGRENTVRRLAAFGRVNPRLRDGNLYQTDSGNALYDLHAGAIDDPPALAQLLAVIPGVVEVGLFLGRADQVIVAGEHGVRTLTPA